MPNACARSRLHVACLLLVSASCLGLPSGLKCQAAPVPAQSAPAANAPLPAAVQAELQKLEAALKAAQAAGDAKAEAKTLNQIGALHFRTSEFKAALDSYNQALAVARSAKNTREETAALEGIGLCYFAEGQNQNAMEFYRQAQDLAASSGDEQGQAAALNGIGIVSASLGQVQEGLDAQSRALPLARKAGDSSLEATILYYAGVDCFELDKSQESLDYFNQALPIFRAAGDRRNEAGVLNGIAIVSSALGDNQKALEYYNQALQVNRQVGDRNAEAGTLDNIGVVYSGRGEHEKALEYYEQALSIVHSIGARSSEATVLNSIGDQYDTLGDLQKALNFSEQSLQIRREIGDRGGEASALSTIGGIYADLGERQRSLDNYSRAVPIYRQVGDRDGEASALMVIGNIYSDLGEKQKALRYLNEALQTQRQASDRDSEAGILTSFGDVYSGLGERQKALDYFNQALPIFHAEGDRNDEAYVLAHLGDVYRDLGENQKALHYYDQALPLATGNLLHEPQILNSMMLDLKVQRPALAIFYGKQAVNLLQQVRRNIRSLDKELQSSYLASKADYYHDLADLLIAQGRLAEAQEVLNLLKEHEYSDYIGANAEGALNPLTLTTAERQEQEDYQIAAALLDSLGEQSEQLKKMKSRTPEQEKQYQDLPGKLDAATKGLNDYFAQLLALFANDSEASKQVADVKGDVDLLRQTIAKLPHTVAIYTLVSKDRTRELLISGTTTVAREYVIPEADLSNKVAQLEEALRNPARDPRPIALSLYKIMIAPLKADLDQAQAETLVWSLDGVLRYVPINALYDGKHYLVEAYNSVTITPASIPHLDELPDVKNLSVAAMGISKQYDRGLPALPAVAGELKQVVRDPLVEGANGVLPGTILLNEQFTEKAMEAQLGGRHAVVHIASHFVFRSGDGSQSYLLLAGKDKEEGGYHLTVSDFRENKDLPLRSTELLTLSACETGLSGTTNDGREVDGLGMTAQRKGARAVISSLWSVNDASTGQLMGDFYRRWAEGAGSVTKVEALRQAQLDLLLGRVRPEGGAAGRGFSQVNRREETVQTGYTHPYYWAPFVLMGNWQ